jgi:hypothetical protein
LVWFGLVWFGLVWFGLVWFGLVWFGLVWFGLVWFGGLGNIVASVHSLINVREQAQVRGQLRFDGSDGLGGLGVCCDKRRGQ